MKRYNVMTKSGVKLLSTDSFQVALLAASIIPGYRDTPANWKRKLAAVKRVHASVTKLTKVVNFNNNDRNLLIDDTHKIDMLDTNEVTKWTI